MASSKAVARIIDTESRVPATVDEVMHHVQIIDEVKRKVMKDGIHYGVIPGCGDKPALLKPGAEKICLTFRLSHEFDIDVEKFPNNHRHYTVTCRLRYRDGTLVGQGIGVCSTMESKYRFRSDNTWQEVPSEYWNARDAALLGGRQFSPKKVKGKWYIVQKVEHDNPADYYNTAAKIAKKRAHVDATLSATAASDIFEQDIDEGVPGGRNDGDESDAGYGADSSRAEEPRSKGGNGKATEPQQKLLSVKLSQSGMPESELLAHFEVGALAEIPFNKVNDALAMIQERAGKHG